MNILHIFLVLLNYFWLSDDPVECASWYCDQHCFKLGSEVIESVWDAVLLLAPDLEKLADAEGIPESNRKRRHSKADGLWHPFSVWNGFCRENMRRSLINADAIFAEHERRTGKQHSAWTDCKFLILHVDDIDFNSKRWLHWFCSQNGSTTTKYTPSKTKPADLVRRKELCREMKLLYRKADDRNTIPMTIPGQYINEKTAAFAGCKVPGDHIAAYRKYYNAKATTVGGGMRYYYSKPPTWLSKAAKAMLLTTPKSKRARVVAKPATTKYPTPKGRGASHPTWARDSDGFVIVKFVE